MIKSCTTILLKKKILTKLLGSRFVKIQWCEDAPHLGERLREWDDDDGDDDDGDDDDDDN